MSIGLFGYYATPQEFTYDYDASRTDVNISSSPSPSFAFKIEYNGQFSDKLEYTVGAIIGMYPTDFNLSFDSTFSVFGRSYEDSYLDDPISAFYKGMYSGIGYIQQLGEKHFLTAKCNINFIHFTPSFYNTAVSTTDQTGMYRFFEAKARMNPGGRKIIMAPELSLKYSYRLFQKILPYLSINGVYSKKYPVVGQRFTIVGKNETLQGSFKRRFLHAGLELGCTLDL